MKTKTMTSEALGMREPSRGHVVMLGMMAAGKTTVGIALAKRLGRRFIDSDRQIEEKIGRQIRQIEQEEGLQAAHKVERAAFEQASAAPRPAVIAVAASITESPEVLRQLTGDAFVVWLRIRPETVIARMAADPGNLHRPSLGATGASEMLAKVAQIDVQRANEYESNADLVLDVDELPPDDAVSAILDASRLPELIVDAHAEAGEGPMWDPTAGVLWWVDITARRIHRFDPKTGHDESWETLEEPTAMALRTSGGLAVTTPRGIAAFDPDKPLAQRLSLLIPIEEDIPSNRANDAKCDRKGRFWVGTMDYGFAAGKGALYRVEPSGDVAVAIPGTALSNGMGWSADDSTFYWTDTLTHEVYAFDFDLEAGTLGERRVLMPRDDEEINPDGLTVDTEGCLWVAHVAKGPGSVSRVPGGVFRIGPDGRRLTTIELPTSYTTSVCFGGEDLGDLYITSGRVDVPEADLAHEPHTGGLFRWRAGVTGTPLHPFAG